MVYSLDYHDTKIVKLIKRLYSTTGNYSGLVDFQFLHNHNEQSVHSALGLMKSYELKYINEVNDTSLLNKAIDLGEDLLFNWGLIDSLYIRVVDKLTDVYILNGNVAYAKNLIKDSIEKISLTSQGLINDLIYNYAKVYFENGEYLEAENILLLGIKNYQVPNSTNYTYISSLANKKAENEFSKNLQLYYLLYSVYKKLNDTDKEIAVLQYILLEDSENKFALKRL